MDGKIDSAGVLEIKRGGKYKKQFCLYQSTINANTVVHCADWCPQFGEPEFYLTVGGKASLDICQGRRLEFKNLKDERGAEDGKE